MRTLDAHAIPLIGHTSCSRHATLPLASA